MSAKYSATFLLLSIGCMLSGLTAWTVVGWFAVPFLYLALSFLALAVAYAGAGPRLLLKRASGQQSFGGWVIFAPYFLLNAVTFAFYRRWSVEPSFVEIAPNVSFGRRLSAGECGACAWVSVLDLACEFGEIPPLRELPGYRSLPVLDATAPSLQQLHAAVAWVAAAAAAGPVYIHCALGHGRSACVVIAYLLSTGRVATVTEGVRRLQGLRPGVRLHACQRRVLQVFEPNRPRASTPEQPGEPTA